MFDIKYNKDKEMKETKLHNILRVTQKSYLYQDVTFNQIFHS